MIEAPKAVKRIGIKGDPRLAKFRERLFRSWARESAELRKPLTWITESVVSEIEEARLVLNDTRLTGNAAKSVDSIVRDSIDEVFSRIESDIEVGAGRAIKRAQQAQVEKLRELGVKVPNSKIRGEIRNKVLSRLDEEFPRGSGLSYRDRLRRIQVQNQKQVSSLVRRTHGEGKAIEKIRSDVTDAFTYSKYGRSPVPGGSALKNVRRLMVAEETRLANEVEVLTLQTAGVEFAYWRLNPAHVWVGNEICEYLSTQVSGETVEKLDKLKLRGVDTEGLYVLEFFPEYPHPHCKCFPEPWIPRT